MREDDEQYFDRIETRLDEAMAVAERAKGQGKDPEPEVEIPIAQDMADRVENILGIPDVAERVRELEGQMSREEAALELAKDFAEGRVGEYDSKAGKIEGAVRTAVALLTEGVVAAPIEGIDRVELLDNDDGTQFVNVYYAGPIRSAGGTAQALSVLVADYTRSILDLAEYKGRDDEIERYVEEINLYDKDTGLQYSPKDKETRFIATNMPIMLDGEATGDLEVSGYRDLDRVDTNSSRGGMCLVMAEGIALKAPKIQRYTRQLDEVEWPWLQDLIDGTIEGEKDGDGDATEDDEDGDTAEEDDTDDETVDEPAGPARVEPKSKYLLDLIAGRPVFGHPSESGGFRLRYGRSRNLGFATAGVHPATMHIIDDFLATGTQIKTEHPGKAAGIIPVDSIEGPTVRLATGEVRRIDDPQEARELRNGVEEILDIGEYLVNYGEFVENNRPLAPASYVYEWWVQEFEAAGADVQAYRDDPHVDLESPTAEEAIEWATEYDCPLHPTYTYVWHDISVEEFEVLAEAVADGERVDDAERGELLVVDRTDTVQTALETLLVAHEQTDDHCEIPDWLPLARSLGVSEHLTKPWDELSDAATAWDGGDNAMEAANEVAPFELRERAPTRIGARMGRPEKSESRDLSPAVHTLFPITEAGGNQRNVAEAARAMDDQGRRGIHTMQINQRACPDCETMTFKSQCPDCGAHTEPHYECDECEIVCEPDEAGRVICPSCEKDVTAAESQTVDLRSEYRGALESITEREGNFKILKGVKGLTSANKTPEAIEKGILRAKHGVSSFKDGTVRYDMTDLPVTAVKPEELDVTVDHFRGLGYETDINGDPLRHDDQLIELRVQDIVLSDGAAEHMIKTADFVDDLLERFYGLPAFYDIEERDDLVGELVFGMAPHTSAAVVGRVVGFTSAAVGYAHPYFHAAKRRNCFHPETKLWLKDEAGAWCHETIETVVEDRLESPRTDDFGTLIQELDADLAVPSIDETGSVVTKRIEALSKHPAPNHMVEIETRSGRELSVTPDHELQVFEDGQRRTKRASELTEQDSLVKPEQLGSVQPAAENPTFDLLAEFIRTDSIDNSRLMIKGIEKQVLYDLFESTLGDDWDGQFYPLKSTAEYFEMSHKTLSNYLYRESVPAEILLELSESVDDVLAFVPDDVRLGMKRDSTDMKRMIEITEEVSTLLGYYAAEGFAREQETPKGTIHQTTICGTEAEARDFYVETFESAFGVSPYRENDAKVTVSGRLIRTFFDTVLDAGIYAETKRVPQCIFNAPDEVVAGYLRGYFSGDGSASSNALKVHATTISCELKEDIFALLTRLGIVGSATTTDPVPLSEKFPDDYETDDPSMSARSYVLRITSHDAVEFAEKVGFHLSRKERQLQTQVNAITPAQRQVFDGGNGEYLVESVSSAECVKSKLSYTYNLTVEDTHSLIVNDLSENQCDGDEDCVMLLMDGLLNFSRQFLPDKRGGSVAEDSRLVAVDPDGNVRFMTFDAFWNELEAPLEVDGKFRKRTCAAEGWQTYTFGDDHNSGLQRIEKAIRYRADDDEQLLRIETQFGRQLEITPNHSLFRYDDGIAEVAGDELTAGDLIVAPRTLDIETTETTIDATTAVDEPYVVIDDHVEDLLTTAWETTNHGSQTHQAFQRGLAYRLNKNKIPYERFERIVELAGFDVPNDLEISLSGSSEGIDRQIEVDEEFAWLLGLYVAEGSTSSVCPTIHNANEELIDRAADIIESALGCEPGRRWSNQAYELRFPAVFRDVLYELGFKDADSYDSSEKVIPDCIRQAPRGVVCSFLQGFIAGDGSTQSDDNVSTIAFYTTSDDVKDGLVFLLHRLGVVATVSEQTERDGNRQDIYTVTVSGGAEDNPLQRMLDGEEPYQPKRLVVTIPDELREIREMDIENVKQLIPKYLKRRDNISLQQLRDIVDELDSRALPAAAADRLDEIRPLVDGDLSYLRITAIEQVDYDGYLYDLQVGGDPIFTANWLYAHNSMDAPLVMSSRIDPAEIDDEAHNMDIVSNYPREFYEATLEMADPEAVDIKTGEDTLGTTEQYRGFEHTHAATDIHMGPSLSAYKTLGSMMDKMDAQLELARKLRAVDETDVAERVIEYHFLPDLIGNLRAFSSQETRCLDCDTKYRRMPLSGECRECGGRVNLTVHEGSVNKYMDTAIEVADRFGCREYTKQRLHILERSLESIFENDKNKQSGIADFM